MRRWWDDDPSERYPQDDLEKYRAAIRGTGEPTDHFLIRLDGRPIGMIQAYRIADDSEYAAALALEEPAVGIDLFIGEGALIGAGHGPALLRRFLSEVIFARYDAPVCVIAPSVENAAAIRAYAKAGFRHLRDAQVPGEASPEHVMRLSREEVLGG